MKLHAAIYLLLVCTLKSQVPAYQWSAKLGSDYSAGIANDSLGNVYSVGYYSGVRDFDPGPGSMTYAAIGQIGVAISKMRSTEQLVWVRHLDASITILASSMVTSKNGEVHFAGFFQGSADFDPGPGVYLLTAPQNINFFVAKLDSSGDFQWAKCIPGPNQSFASGIALDGTGNVYVSGVYTGNLDFDPGPGTFTMTAPLPLSNFLMKLDLNGVFIWALNIESAILQLTANSTGFVYIAGYCDSNDDLDPGPSGYNLSGAGVHASITKLSPNGTFVWARGLSGQQGSVASIHLALNDRIYLTGSYQGSIDADPGPNSFVLSGSTKFAARLDSNGNFLDAFDIDGFLIENYKGNDQGNSFLVGRSILNADLDIGPATYSVPPGKGAVIKMNNLSFEWASVVEGQNLTQIHALSISGEYIYTAGRFQGVADFYTGAGEDTMHCPYPSNRGFLARYCEFNSGITALATPSIICAGQSATLSASGGSNYFWNTGNSGSTTVIQPAATSVFTVSEIGENSCYNRAIVEINVATPTAAILSMHPFLCPGMSTTLIASGGSEYIWGSQSNQFQIIITPTVTTVYTLTAYSTHGCSSTVTYTQLIQNCTDLELDLDNEFILFPCPAQDYFYVESESNGEVCIYDIFGRCITQYEITSGINRILCEDLVSGIYFVRARIQQKLFQKQIVIYK